MGEMNLSGQWKFRLDSEEVGKNEHWFNQEFESSTFLLPGTTATNKIGKLLKSFGKDRLIKEDVESYKEEFQYRGELWLQRKIVIPRNWGNGIITLEFERILGISEVWINGEHVGVQENFSIPHRYRLDSKKLLQGTEYTLTVRINNNNVNHLGELASGYSSHTQTFWSGIVGKMRIRHSSVLEEDIQVSFDTRDRVVKISVGGPSAKAGQLKVTIYDKQYSKVDYQPLSNERLEDIVQYKFKIMTELKWNEFSQNYYLIEVSDGEDVIIKPFGILDLTTDKDAFYMDGKKIFLRGTLDCSIFPNTGYPPTDKKSWEKILKTVKDYGLNHIRFHSWCPPEEAFCVANELGLYLMVEGPFWLDDWFHNSVGDFPEHYEIIKNECTRILRNYGHHPSFCFFAVGNELAGDFGFLAELFRSLSFHENQVLTTLTANTTNGKRILYDGADDFFVGVEYKGKGLRGNRFLDSMVLSTKMNYNHSAKEVPLPVITHEIGQYASYPDITEVEKFTGLIIPLNTLAIKEDLKRNNLLSYSDAFLNASGKLSAELYKAEIEATVRSNEVGGYQLLGLQDYPGQNTATVGLLDSFWESKGIVEAEWFRGFCSDIVPILEMEKRIFSQTEKPEVNIGVRNNGASSYEKVRVTLELRNSEELIFTNIFDCSSIQGEYGIVGSAVFDFSSLSNTSNKLIVSIKLFIEDKHYYNQWEIWVYKEQADEMKGEIISDNWLSERIVHALEQGKTCLLTPNPNAVRNIQAGNFFPVFWSPVFFESKDACGMIVENNHPIFKHFVSDNFASFQWKNLLENSINFKLDTVQGITTLVPNFFNNEYRSNLFEVSVGEGKLVVCGFDIDRDDYIEQRAFKNALYQYLKSEEFAPRQQMSVAELQSIFLAKNTNEIERSQKDVAYKKRAWADNEKSMRMGADKGNDGNSLTYWTTTSQTDGHWWCVDLGELYRVNKIIVEPLNHKDMSFLVEISEDGLCWSEYASSKEHLKKHVLNGSGVGQYVRITYFHPLNIAPGQYSCKVFSQN